MRVLIYAPAARMGGARAHVLGLVPELAAISPMDQFLLLAQPDLLVDLPRLPPTWTLRVERAEMRGFLGRLAWEQLVLPRIAERWHADVLLSFGSFVPLRLASPSVLEAGNALPFTRAYWHMLRQQPLRLRIEEGARWLLLCASLRVAKRVLTPTRAMRQDVLSRLPDLAPKIDVALWGVASVFQNASWSPPESDAVLGVSKHGINKEFDVLIEAIAELAHKWPNLHLVLTGAIDESRWSRRSFTMAKQLGVSKQVQFVGDVPNANIPDLIQRARLLVFPTWCESFGLPLAEALAMGAPAVAADIPACREVGEDAAVYYCPGDSQSLATEIGALLASPEKSRDLARRARERGRTFTWHANAIGVRQSLMQAVA